MAKLRPLVLLIAALAGTLAKRDEKLLSVFTIVNFPNDVCTGTSGDTGTCFTTTECTSKAGSSDGNCASGFGVCCVFSTSTCGASVTQNTSYITNPSFPTAYTTAGSCAFSITPLSSNICQLRLDFTSFVTGVTTADGTCADSLAIVVGSKLAYPGICGTNTGEHIYLETGQSTSAQTLTFTVASSVTFKILVHQIPCGVNYAAPSDCLQYFTGEVGRARTFNFDGQIVLVNQQYTQCVRQESGYCGIMWSETQGVTGKDTFKLSADATALTGVGPANDEVSFVCIPGSMNRCYSGTNFAPLAAIAQTSSGSVFTSSLPFILQFQSVTATQVATGYDLTWKQVPCA